MLSRYLAGQHTLRRRSAAGPISLLPPRSALEHVNAPRLFWFPALRPAAPFDVLAQLTGKCRVDNLLEEVVDAPSDTFCEFSLLKLLCRHRNTGGGTTRLRP